MSAVFMLTLRQLAGRWRLAIMTILATLPPLITAVMVNDGSATSIAEFESVVLGALLAGSIAPLVVLAIAGPAFGDEVEDRTLANLTLTPLPRWKLVVPKFLASVAIAAPFVVASAAATAWLAFLGEPAAVLATAMAALVGVLLYAAAFTWLGLVSTQAIALGLVYIVLWEGFFSGFVAGVRLLSIRWHAIAFMHGLDARRFARADHPDFVWVVALTLVTVPGFLWLATRRLRTMDVP